MKKILSMCAAVAAMMMAVTLQSCEKEDVITGENTTTGLSQFIAEYANVDTKSNAVVSETAKVESFSMSIYRADTLVVGNSTFTEDATTKVWGNGINYYWAKDSEYTYVATLNNNKAESFGTKSDGKVTVSAYEVKTDGTTANYVTGVKTGGIYMDATTSTQQDDPCVAIKTDVKNTANNAVELKFYHALARVRVVAKASFGSAYKLQAKFLGFEFRGVGVKGDSEITNAASIAWKNQTTGCVRDNRYNSDNLSISYLNANYASLSTDSWCNVIPADATTQLVAKVAFYDQDGKYVATRYLTADDDDITKTTKNEKPSTYAAGSQYTYYVDIVNGGGDDTDGGDPDAPLAKIKVTEVTVEAWKDVDGGTATFGK